MSILILLLSIIAITVLFQAVAMTSPHALSLLRLIPALNSTLILMFAFDEYSFLSKWMHPSYRTQSNALLPLYFTQWVNPGGIPVIILTFSIAIATSLANIFTHREELREAGAEKWYWMGFAFQVAHFIFGPTVIKLLNDIRGDVPKGEATKSLRTWLRVHIVRSFTTDLPAWIFFIVAKVASEQK